MNFIQVAILSLIEGITEFLPISSTGHLILASNLLGISQDNFFKTFGIVIQIGAIGAVFLLYLKKLFQNPRHLLLTFLAFLPTGIIGLLFYDLVKSVLLENEFVTVMVLFTGGVILLFIDQIDEKQNLTLSEISTKKILFIGMMQSISIIPGVSRSAASIIGGLLVGLDRKTAVEFSFLLALPTIFAASGYDLLKSSLSFSSQEFFYLSLGIIISFLTASIAIKFLLRYIENKSFKIFGVYRIILAILYFVFML